MICGASKYEITCTNCGGLDAVVGLGCQMDK
jgi:hypothetical protein